MRWRIKTVYHFTAIVGQEKIKTALILNVINPEIGSVLLQKGNWKSLAVRAFVSHRGDEEKLQALYLSVEDVSKGISEK